MAKETTVTGLWRDAQGLCTPEETTLVGGVPMRGLSGELELVGRTEIGGWGELDGPAEVWELASVDPKLARPALLLPESRVDNASEDETRMRWRVYNATGGLVALCARVGVAELLAGELGGSFGVDLSAGETLEQKARGIASMIMVRAGETVTAELARERANNIATAFLMGDE